MYNIYNIIIITIFNTVHVCCAYLGTIKGKKLNEPEPDLSKTKTSRMDSACRALSGSDGFAGLYSEGLSSCLLRCSVISDHLRVGSRLKLV